MSVIFGLLVALICVAAIALPVVLIVYVYNDAKSRNMNALLWVLVTLLLPVPIGLIVYLVAREQTPAARCANCGESVKESYMVCPRCCAPLHSACPNCGCVVQPGWTVCPRCGTNVANIAPTKPAVSESRPHTGRNVAIVVLILVFLIVSAGVALFTVVALRFSPEISTIVEEVRTVDNYDELDEIDDVFDDMFDYDENEYDFDYSDEEETAESQTTSQSETTTSEPESEPNSIPNETFVFEVN